MALKPNGKRKVGKIKNIALVAHDSRKPDILEWAKFNVGSLDTHNLWATGTTGKLLEKKLGLEINKLKSGPMGGDQQIGAMIAENKLDVVVFFWDPLSSHVHDVDIKALVRIAAVHNVIMACDRATADFVFSSPLMQSEYEIIMKDYSSYIDRFEDGLI
jgi:methylglyoxal synthase